MLVVQQEGETFHRFVREPAAARFFPRQVLVKNPDFVPRSRKLLAAHCAGGPAPDDRYL
jgi:hypothetical protein